MPTIKNNSENKIYLSVTFGKLRQKTLSNGKKVDENTPNATLRETKSGEKSWAIEFDSVKGMIEGINLKTHEEYGESMELLIREESSLCSLTFKSLSFQQIMNYLPNIKFDKIVEINTFSYINKNGRITTGLNLLQEKHENTKEIIFENGEKINTIIPYYKKWEDNKWHYMNGCPSAEDVNFMNKKEMNIYNLNLE